MSSNTIPIVFLGIDVHKRTYSITAVSNNAIIKRASMCAEPQVLLAFINKHFSNATVYSVYEAGFSGFGLHRFLIANSISNIVVHAASIEVPARDKNKNDKRDSQKMAFDLSYGKLHSVHIPTPQREAWRAVSRQRTQYVKEKARTSCKLKGLLFYFGLISHDHKGRTSRKWVLKLLNLKDINKDIAFCINNFVDTWLYFDRKIKELDIKLKEQAKKDFKINDIYRSDYGIGLTSSRILANELGDLSQFASSRQLYGFTGLTPIERSSGDNKRLGKISRQGNTIVRAILTEAAWKAIHKDQHLSEVFDRLVKNTGSRKKSILGIARRMIGRTRAKFNKGKDYIKEEDYLKKGHLCIK